MCFKKKNLIILKYKNIRVIARNEFYNLVYTLYNFVLRNRP